MHNKEKTLHKDISVDGNVHFILMYPVTINFLCNLRAQC